LKLKHNFNYIHRLIRNHEEAVHTIAFSADSNVLLTACTLGNIRLLLVDDYEINNEADCFIDCAHDMGVLGSDFCKLIHKDRKFLEN
jgi:hypothetical protein